VRAVRTGLEPATLGVTGRYSNQLNYRTKVFFRDLIFIKSGSFLQNFQHFLKNKPPEIRFSKGFANIAFLSFPAIGQIKKISPV
jgi:hypothetical protein